MMTMTASSFPTWGSLRIWFVVFLTLLASSPNRKPGHERLTDRKQIPDIPLNYEKSELKGVMKWAFPTICLSLDIKRDPKGEEWLLQRTVMSKYKD